MTPSHRDEPNKQQKVSDVAVWWHITVRQKERKATSTSGSPAPFCVMLCLTECTCCISRSQYRRSSDFLVRIMSAGSSPATDQSLRLMANSHSLSHSMLTEWNHNLKKKKIDSLLILFYSPANRTGSPQGFSQVQISHKLNTIQNIHIIINYKRKTYL